MGVQPSEDLGGGVATFDANLRHFPRKSPDIDILEP
jgi:hypothetical protein